MSDKNSSINGGVKEVTLRFWDEFHQEAYKLKSKRGFVWRGQKKDEDGGWFLNSSFDRFVSYSNQLERDKKLEKLLERFKNEMAIKYPNVLPIDDLEIWAIGQHYGLKTPLIDWTLSPYIAAFFAFSEKIDKTNRDDNYRYIYALNRSIERHKSKEKKVSQVLSSERSVPFIEKLVFQNPRFTAQKGVFTKAFKGRNINDYVQNFSEKRPDEILIIKYMIPSEEREKCLKELSLMNIDHMSLLLDFNDIVDSCNNKI